MSFLFKLLLYSFDFLIFKNEASGLIFNVLSFKAGKKINDLRDIVKRNRKLQLVLYNLHNLLAGNLFTVVEKSTANSEQNWIEHKISLGGYHIQ